MLYSSFWFINDRCLKQEIRGVWQKQENMSRNARTTKSRKPSAVKPKHLRTRRTLKSESFHEKLFHAALAATTFHSEKLQLWWIKTEFITNRYNVCKNNIRKNMYVQKILDYNKICFMINFLS